MTLAFPSAPTVGDKYTEGSRTWSWDGVKWALDRPASAGPGGGALPGLGGWAEITAVTGSPQETTYTDTNGTTWKVWTFTGAGSITTTAGLLDVLVVGAGSGASPQGGGGGGGVRTGIHLIPATTHAVTVGAAGAVSTTGGMSAFGNVAAAMGGVGAGPVAIPGSAALRPNNFAGGGGGQACMLDKFGGGGAGAPAGGTTTGGVGLHSSITGTDAEYGRGGNGPTGGPVGIGYGGNMDPSNTPYGGEAGAVIVRRPA
jgi:hypothetical protein